jgi:hypothetical protein
MGISCGLAYPYPPCWGCCAAYSGAGYMWWFRAAAAAAALWASSADTTTGVSSYRIGSAWLGSIVVRGSRLILAIFPAKSVDATAHARTGKGEGRTDGADAWLKTTLPTSPMPGLVGAATAPPGYEAPILGWWFGGGSACAGVKDRGCSTCSGLCLPTACSLACPSHQVPKILDRVLRMGLAAPFWRPFGIWLIGQDCFGEFRGCQSDPVALRCCFGKGQNDHLQTSWLDLGAAARWKRRPPACDKSALRRYGGTSTFVR